MSDDKQLGRDAQALMRAVVETGLHGVAPHDYAKQMVFAKRMLEKKPLEHWLEVVEALRGFVFPYSEGATFDLHTLQMKEARALGEKKRIGETDDTPRWLRGGFANDEPMQRPELGEEW